MATATTSANHFELHCDGVQITFDTTSLTGDPRFSYSGPEGDLNFSGKEIETLPSALGAEVTVTLETVSDLHTITLTLLLPSFKLPDDGASKFETLAIKTTNHTTIAGPPAGPGQSYEALALHGVASEIFS